MTKTATPQRSRKSARKPTKGTATGDNSKAASNEPAPASTPTGGATGRPESKIGQVTALLRRAEGATLEEMVAAAGWQPHTTRAALTGLRKKGHTITRGKRENVTCYHLAEPA